MLTVKSTDGIEIPLPAAMMVHFSGGKAATVRTIEHGNPGVWVEWPVEYYIIFGSEMLMHPEEYTVLDNIALNGTVQFMDSDTFLSESKKGCNLLVDDSPCDAW